jgi:hypothetical protein
MTVSRVSPLDAIVLIVAAGDCREMLHITLIVDTRVLGCVADSLQERHFASISPTYYKDTKA